MNTCSQSEYVQAETTGNKEKLYRPKTAVNARAPTVYMHQLLVARSRNYEARWLGQKASFS